jgi:hypothetical protein
VLAHERVELHFAVVEYKVEVVVVVEYRVAVVDSKAAVVVVVDGNTVVAVATVSKVVDFGRRVVVEYFVAVGWNIIRIIWLVHTTTKCDLN